MAQKSSANMCRTAKFEYKLGFIAQKFRVVDPFYLLKLIMTNKKVTVAWLRELIRKGDTSAFYNTNEWGQLRERKRKLEHNECERCREKGIHKRGVNVHHKKYLRRYPELALNINNLECLCDECHYEEHHKIEPLTPERW